MYSINILEDLCECLSRSEIGGFCLKGWNPSIARDIYVQRLCTLWCNWICHTPVCIDRWVENMPVPRASPTKQQSYGTDLEAYLVHRLPLLQKARHLQWARHFQDPPKTPTRQALLLVAYSLLVSFTLQVHPYILRTYTQALASPQCIHIVGSSFYIPDNFDKELQHHFFDTQIDPTIEWLFHEI